MEEVNPTLSPANVTEGDDVVMVVSPHAIDVCPTRIEGTVMEAPAEDDNWTRDRLEDGEPLMVNFTVETEDGDSYTWQVDNGYVIGYHPALDRHTDVAKFRKFEAA